jgi:hypothetical protein
MLNINTFTQAQAGRILELYAEIVGGNVSFMSANYLHQKIIDTKGSNAWYDGFRLGSRWDHHSKLSFRRDRDGNFTALFNPNFDPRDRKTENPRYQAALDAGRRFEEAVKALQ